MKDVHGQGSLFLPPIMSVGYNYQSFSMPCHSYTPYLCGQRRSLCAALICFEGIPKKHNEGSWPFKTDSNPWYVAFRILSDCKLIPSFKAPGLVPCHCEQCGGSRVPRSTRDGHADRAQRRKSALPSRSAPAPPFASALSEYLAPPSEPNPPLASAKHPPAPSTSKTAIPPSLSMMLSSTSTIPSLAQDDKDMSSPPSRRAPAEPHPSAEHQPSSPAKNLASIASAESRGTEYMTRVLASGIDLTPIADDHWEEVDEEVTEVLGVPESIEELAPPPTRPPAPLASTPLPSANTRQSGPHDENSPDPFQQIPVDPVPMERRRDVRAHPLIYLWYLLVAWLHTHFHLPFRACNAVLVVGAIIFKALGTSPNPAMLTTLNPVLSALEIQPNFAIFPVCPQCQDVFPAGVAVCGKCSLPLYRGSPGSDQQHAGPQATPLLQFPFKSLEEQLRAVLAVPGMEDQLDHWRKKQRQPGVYKDMFDGRISKELCGADGLPFFRHDLQEMPDGELRLGVTLGADW